MRLAIGMEVLILRPTWFYERRTTTMTSIFFCLFCACQRRAERWEEPRLPGKKAAERGDPQKQGKHRRQSSRPPLPHRSHFLCAVMRFFHLSLPQADIGLRLRKNSVILCDVFGPGIPHPNVSAFKYAAFLRKEGRHVLRRSQTGHATVKVSSSRTASLSRVTFVRVYVP